MNQSSRTNSLEEFKNKSADILVASDVAARGIDIKNLSHVFNYDVPNNPEDYVHRIGRTGSAGKKGKAYTIFNQKEEKNILLIEKLIKKKIKKLNIEDINLNNKNSFIKDLKLKINQDKTKNKNKKKQTKY
jgi:ATP-dependent RNA helicase RhlE